ncbi:MAG: hypothetical protein HYU25_07500 [Candidatus Rokubacteria bacterium]|nr:hypothetical protein [Candidatus Rokubacteria bacterium]
MPLKLNVAKADLSVESGFAQPEFGLFRDTPKFLQHLFTRLQPHAPQLQNLKIERGNNSIAEFHVVCHLYNFRVGVRVFTEKVGVVCIDVQENEVERFETVIVDALSAVKEHQPAVAFRTHTMGVMLHGTLQDKSARDYLATFVKNVPSGLGPHTGNGAVIYFGAQEDRILSSITMDLSALVPDGLFLRPYVVWDANKIEVAALPARATAFVRQALDAFGLEVPTLRSS